MTASKVVLTPVDFSEASVRAARAAMAWAERIGAELHLLHVVPDAIEGRTADALREFSPQTFVEDWTRGTRDALDALAATLSADGRRIRVTIRLGDPVHEITRYAAEESASLIVLASRSHSAISRALLGSVAERVVREAPCPVLTVPADVDVTRWSEDHEGVLRHMTLRKMVVLTDFSDISHAALTYAHDLARQLGAALHVVHVVPPAGERQLAYVPPPIDQPDELRWRAQRWLMRAVESFSDVKGIVTETRQGAPSQEAIAYAEQVSADVLVVATHGRGAIDRLLLGSVAHDVLRRAHCPVLTVNQVWFDAARTSVNLGTHEVV
jgi:nucleotide-binding universal stress UspA family protein